MRHSTLRASDDATDQVLAREDEHNVLQPCLVDLPELRVAQRLAQVDARNLGTGGET